MLLLDEPLGALDLKLRKGLQVELKRIQREVGITFVYVTHDQEEALTMSDRIAVMNDGRVEQVGRPRGGLRAAGDHLRRRLHRRLQPDARDRGGGRRGAPRQRADRRDREVNGFRPGERCHAVVRPEKLRIDRIDEASDGRLPSVEGTVESSVYLGTSTQIVVELGGDVRMTVLYPNADEAERQRLPGGGAPVRLSWQPEHMHLVRESAAGAPAEEEAPAPDLTKRKERTLMHSTSQDNAAIPDAGRGGPDAGDGAGLIAACGGDDVGGGSEGEIAGRPGGQADG